MSTRKCGCCGKRVKTNDKELATIDFHYFHKRLGFFEGKKFPIDVPYFNLRKIIPIFKDTDAVGFQVRKTWNLALYDPSLPEIAAEGAVLAKGAIGVKYRHHENYYDDGAIDYRYKTVLFKDVPIMEQRIRRLNKRLGGEEDFTYTAPLLDDFKNYWQFHELVYEDDDKERFAGHRRLKLRQNMFFCKSCLVPQLRNQEIRERANDAFSKMMFQDKSDEARCPRTNWYFNNKLKFQAVRRIENWWLRTSYDPKTYIGAKKVYQRGIEDGAFTKEDIDIKYWTDEQFLEDVPMPTEQ